MTVIGSDINPQDDTAYQIILQAFSLIHIEVSAPEKIMIRKFHMEFDTVFMVRTAKRSYIFGGNR